MEKRTLEALRRQAEEMGLRPGRTIEVTGTLKTGEENTGTKEKRKGTVLRLYATHFVCDMGRFNESFRYNELLGNEAGRKVRLCGF